MRTSVGLPVRSFLTAGVSATMVGAVALAPVTVSRPMTVAAPIQMIAPQIQLTTAGDTIIAAYTALQPWVAYGFELADYAMSFVPGLWWIAPAIDLAYFTAQPLIEAAVYSFAFLIDGNWTLIGPTVQTGIQNSVDNFIEYSIAWIGSLVPLPPLPPLPPFPGAAVKAPAAAPVVTARNAARVAAAAATATAETESATDTATPDAAATTAVATTTVATTTVAAPRSRRDAARTNSRAAHQAAPAAEAAASPAAAAGDAAGDGAAPVKLSSRKAQRGA